MNFRVYAFWLAIFGALCWGLAPAFGKAGLREVTPISGLAARTLITVFLVWGGFLIIGGFQGVMDLKTISLRGWLALGIEAFLATIAGDLAYFAAIKYGEIGETALVLAASPLVTLWFGWYFYNEGVTLIKIIGGSLILLGVILVGVS